MTRPLDVQLAELLGWRDIARYPGSRTRYWGIPPSDVVMTGYSEEFGYEVVEEEEHLRIPLFSKWWSAIGPLIEKYHIDLLWSGGGWRYFLPNGVCSMAPDGKVHHDADPKVAAVKALIAHLKDKSKPMLHSRKGGNK